MVLAETPSERVHAPNYSEDQQAKSENHLELWTVCWFYWLNL